MDQMMQGKLVIGRWTVESRRNVVADGSRQRQASAHGGRLWRWARSLLRQAGHELSLLGNRLERLGELWEPAGAGRRGG